jgi:hypothetical protein
MPSQGGSVDDLPLAAYSTGVDPESEPDLGPPTDAAPPSEGPFGRAIDDDLPGDPFGQAAPPHDEVAAAAAPSALREVLRNPRANARDPRLIFSGVVVIGVVLLALSLLGGGGARGPAAAFSSPTPPSGPVVTVAPPGNASVAFAGSVSGTFDLTGISGTGRPSGTTMDSSWGDQLGNALDLGGPVSAGTRTTDAGFVLSWTVMVNGKAVTFTSKAGECTIGMAVKPTTISGSFTCHKVKSADGKLTVGASGTYRT